MLWKSEMMDEVFILNAKSKSKDRERERDRELGSAVAQTPCHSPWMELSLLVSTALAIMHQRVNSSLLVVPFFRSISPTRTLYSLLIHCVKVTFRNGSLG